MLKKISALLLALVMVLSLCAGAMAATTLGTAGEQGAFTSPDTPVVQSKTLNLEKELKVYNLDEATVNAPTITYNYTVEAGTAGKDVTDKADKHDPEGSVTAPTKAGIVKGVKINDGTAATGTTATGTLSFTTTDELDATTDGAKNVKDIAIDFSGVVFTGPGIYRYKITESLASGFTYDNTGVTETTGSHVRYIDVYVKPADSYTDGSKNTDWDIYGFTCFYNDEDITDADKTTAAVKTTGFVDGTKDGSTAVLGDQYYTYNLTIKKLVVDDNYAKANHAFPFTVIFTNSDVTKNILLKTTVAEGATDFTHAAGAPTWKGIAKLKDSTTIKYIGIPMGTDVEVYETNDVAGVTYKVTTDRTNFSATETKTDAMVISGSTPTEATAQAATKADYQSTKSTLDTTKNADDDNKHEVTITNKLVTISPTGVALRVAPYVLILAAGMALLLISRRRKAVVED